MMNCHYRSFLIDEIRLDLQDNIFYFPYLWDTSYNRPLGRADRTFILGWHHMGLNADAGRARGLNGLLWGSASGQACFIGLESFLGPGEWACEPYFSTLSYPNWHSMPFQIQVQNIFGIHPSCLQYVKYISRISKRYKKNVIFL